jgi:hypothetical protein
MTARVCAQFTWAGAILSVSVPVRAWLARLSDLLDLVADPQPDALSEIRVHDATHLRSFETELTFATQSDLLVWLVLTIVDVLAEKARVFLIHAASLQIGGELVLLSGAPHTGKSTLALRARQRGMAVLGDDVVRFDLEALLASPVPRPLRERVGPEVARLAAGDPLCPGVALVGLLDGEGCRLHPRTALPERMTEGAMPISAVYFLRRHSGPGLRLDTPGSFDTIANFLGHVRAWGPQKLAALPKVARLLKQCDCVLLSIGDGEMDLALDMIGQRQTSQDRVAPPVRDQS